MYQVTPVELFNAHVKVHEDFEYNLFLEELKQKNIREARQIIFSNSCVEAYQYILNAVTEEFATFDTIYAKSAEYLNALYGDNNPFDKADVCAMLDSLVACDWVEQDAKKIYRGEYLAGALMTYKKKAPKNFHILSGLKQAS